MKVGSPGSIAVKGKYIGRREESLSKNDRQSRGTNALGGRNSGENKKRLESHEDRKSWKYSSKRKINRKEIRELE